MKPVCDDLEIRKLKDVLTRIDRSDETDWHSNLEDRKRAEAEFHDGKVDRKGYARGSVGLPEAARANMKYYSAVQKSREYVASWLASHVKDKIFLDYACGQGGQTIVAAKNGASLAIGLDISEMSIRNARADATEDGLADRTMFIVGDCENTGLPDSSVDAILCSGMLHHLDVNHAFPEMRRILKPGGVCLGIEALDYNPLIKLYRKLTPSLRTEWEKYHILSRKELRVASRYFEVRNVRFWHLFSILATPFRKTPLFSTALRFGNAIDSVVLNMPLTKYLAWQFSFELWKPSE